jgi:hypothetical protein
MGVSSSVSVDLQQQVVLLSVDKVGRVKISRFEVGVELQQHLLVDVARKLCFFFLGDIVILISTEWAFVSLLADEKVKVIARHLECLRFVSFVNSVLEKLGVEFSFNWRDLLHFDLV